MPASPTTPQTDLVRTEPVYTVAGEQLNRFDLYERCVQEPYVMARFARAVHGGSPVVLADDFAGPAAIARAWLDLDSTSPNADKNSSVPYRSYAVDADELPLAHAALKLQQDHAEAGSQRLAFYNCDVLEVDTPSDIITACNFALCELHTRAALLAYLKNARKRLNNGGVLVADLYGGPNAMTPGSYTIEVPAGEQTVHYHWQQAYADPFSSRVRNAIHFDVPTENADQQKQAVRINNAFTYDWRLWSPAEVCDAMLEAGFVHAEVHTGYGNEIADNGDPIPTPVNIPATDEQLPSTDEDWVVYVVGRAPMKTGWCTWLAEHVKQALQRQLAHLQSSQV